MSLNNESFLAIFAYVFTVGFPEMCGSRKNNDTSVVHYQMAVCVVVYATADEADGMRICFTDVFCFLFFFLFFRLPQKYQTTVLGERLNGFS